MSGRLGLRKKKGRKPAKIMTLVKKTAEEPKPLLIALCSKIFNKGYGPSPVRLRACSPCSPMEMTWRELGQAKWKALEDILLEGLFTD